MIDKLINLLLETYLDYEIKKISRKIKINGVNLPSYVTKRQIIIYNNGEIVFDSNTVDKIPNDIKYTIKRYGIPNNIRPNNKTPLIYNVKTTLSSIFPDSQIEKQFLDC